MGQGYHTANQVQQENDKDSLLANSLNYLALAATTNTNNCTIKKIECQTHSKHEMLNRKLEQALNTITILTRASNNSFPTQKQRTIMQLKYDL